MKTYEIRVPLKGDAVFTVDAYDEEDARVRHINGRSEFQDDEIAYVAPPFGENTPVQITEI